MAEAKRVAEETFAAIKAEYAATDPDAQMAFEPYKCEEGECCDHSECLYVPEEDALRFIRAVLACPDGVERMSSDIPGLVETSNNLAVVKIEKGEFALKTLMRSSVDSAKEALAEKFDAVFKLAGISTEFTGGYSGWAPNPSSAILATMKKAYPHWDMVSFGPTLLSPHSPDERANIPSVVKAWDFLKAVLAAIPEK